LQCGAFGDGGALGRAKAKTRVSVASLSEDETSMVGLSFGARRFWFRRVDGGVPSSLLLSLELLFESRVAISFLLFLEGRAVSLLDGFFLECSSACLSEEKPRNFVASLRVLNFLWCRLSPFVIFRHSFHEVVSSSGSSPLFRTAQQAAIFVSVPMIAVLSAKNTVFPGEIWMGGCGEYRGLHAP
jgi:hypothetical protein